MLLQQFMVVGAGTRSIMVSQVPESGQGELQGALSSLVGFTALFAPILMTRLFGYYSTPDSGLYFPGAAFFAAGILVCIGLIILLRQFRYYFGQDNI